MAKKRLEDVLVLVNPISGNGKWQRKPQLKECLEKYVDGEIILTKSKGHTFNLAKEKSRKVNNIVAIGGDGTVLDVINGIMFSYHWPKPTLGIIPLGTGNCYVDSLGISKHFEKACKNLTEGMAKEVDLVKVFAIKKISSKFRVYHHIRYSQVASIGLDAYALNLRNESGKAGFKGYVGPALKTLLEYKPQPKKITMKNGVWFGGSFDEKVLNLENNLQTVITKGKYYGFKFKISPKAVLDDGLLDVSLFNMGKAKTFMKFPKIYFGKEVNGIAHFKAKEVVVEGSGLVGQHDGEYLGCFDEYIFEVSPKALKIIMPKG